MVALLVSCALAVQARAGTQVPRAVWVRKEDSFLLLDDDEFRNDTMAFLERQRISTLYLYADEFRGRNVLAHEPERYRRLITALHGRGLRVYALLGPAPLRTQEYVLPEKRAAAVRMFGAVLAYDAASGAASRFDGVSLDIEPYPLDDWSDQKPLRARQYLCHEITATGAVPRPDERWTRARRPFPLIATLRQGFFGLNLDTGRPDERARRAERLVK